MFHKINDQNYTPKSNLSQSEKVQEGSRWHVLTFSVFIKDWLYRHCDWLHSACKWWITTVLFFPAINDYFFSEKNGVVTLHQSIRPLVALVFARRLGQDRAISFSGEILKEGGLTREGMERLCKLANTRLQVLDEVLRWDCDSEPTAEEPWNTEIVGITLYWHDIDVWGGIQGFVHCSHCALVHQHTCCLTTC